MRRHLLKRNDVGLVSLAPVLMAVAAVLIACSSSDKEAISPTTSTTVPVIYDELVAAKAGDAVQLQVVPDTASPGEPVTIGFARPDKPLYYVWAGRLIDKNLVHWEWAMEPSGDINGRITPDNQPHGRQPTILCKAGGCWPEPDLWVDTYELPTQMMAGDWVLCANGPNRQCGAITIKRNPATPTTTPTSVTAANNSTGVTP